MLARGRDIHDDVLAKHVITVPEVRLSPDLARDLLHHALGGQDIAPVLKALDANKRHIRGEIAHRVNLKYAPDLRFRQDESFDEAARTTPCSIPRPLPRHRSQAAAHRPRL